MLLGKFMVNKMTKLEKISGSSFINLVVLVCVAFVKYSFIDKLLKWLLCRLQ